jgi:hypothetical protein
MNFFNNLGHDFQHLGGGINNAFHPQQSQPARTQRPPLRQVNLISRAPIFHGGYIQKPAPIPINPVRPPQPVNTHLSKHRTTHKHTSCGRSY